MTDTEANRLLLDLFPERPGDLFGRFAIGDTVESMNACAEAIVLGIKTATSALPGDFPDGVRPFPGALSLLEDGSGNPRAVVETLSVSTIRFRDVTSSFAEDYGEGDRTLAWFQVEMGAWYKRRDPEFGPDSWLVAEYFKVVRSPV